MKYAFLICDGASDWKIKELNNQTIFEYAKTPNMDFLSERGYMGLLKTVPDGIHPGSESANMSIMGYNPKTDLTGRGPLEALSAGVKLSSTDIAFRCNVITIQDGLIEDYSSGHITTEESVPLIAHIQETLGKMEGVDFYPGIQYRHILKLDGNQYSDKVQLIPPHDQLGKPYLDFLATPLKGYESDEKAIKTADLLNTLIEKSQEILINHPINKKRKDNDKKMATHIWPWSGGPSPKIVPFNEKYGLSGSVISAVDLIFGIGIAAGLKPIHVEGATGLPDTNYEGKVEAGLKSLKEDDYLYLHVEATDEMGHAGDVNRKLEAMESFDKRIVQPFIEAEDDFNQELVIIILPDHPTPIEIRTHTREPVPFVVFYPKDTSNHPGRKYSEESGKIGGWGLIESGEEFIKKILKI